MGTSGGIGADAGTVVVATEGVDGLLRPVCHRTHCGAVRATNGRTET
jgi:hypothetical protein